MDGVRRFGFFLIPLCLWGCSRSIEAPFPDWIGEARIAHAGERPSGFEALAKAAERAETRAGANASRVSFTPGRADALVLELSGPTNEAIQAVSKGARPKDRFAPPFQALPYQKGWRLIGHVLVWRTERHVAKGELPAAVNDFAAASRFGLALTAGSAADASLGYTIVEDAAKAFLPAMARMPSQELRRLGTAMEAVLAKKPDGRSLVENELASMKFAVQHVQDAYRDRKLGGLADSLGKEVEPAIEALEGLRRKGPKERVAYFEGFAAEAEVWADRYRDGLAKNARQRAATAIPEWKGDRPWRRFAKHFFTTLEPMAEMRDRAICRLRLLGLQALLQAECRANGAAPSSLTGISAALTTDPYRGLPFLYRPEGDHFLLYSVGPNLKDDGGEDGVDVRIDD